MGTICNIRGRSIGIRRLWAAGGPTVAVKQTATALAGALFVVLFGSAFARAADFKVYTYASQPRFHDSVNTHWIETPNGLIVIDTQRLLSESRRAVQHIRSIGKPVLAVFITHAHSDHYGGLPVFRQVFPDAPVYANRTTTESIRVDRRGYSAARKKRLGDDFASQAQLEAALPDRIITAGQQMEIDGLRIRIDGVDAGEAEEGIVLYLPERGTLFAADNLNNGFVPAPLESLDGWLATLDKWERRYPPDTRVYVGHGREGRLDTLINNQRRYLRLLRKEVQNAITDRLLTVAERDRIAFILEREFPHAHGVGGNPRLAVIQFVVGHVAQQYGATVEALPEFR